jgi:hypothetical protein
MLTRDEFSRLYDSLGREKFVEFCNTENEKGRNILEEFILEEYEAIKVSNPEEADMAIYNIVANGGIDLDHVAANDGVTSIELLRKIDYDLCKFLWVLRIRDNRIGIDSLQKYVEMVEPDYW